MQEKFPYIPDNESDKARVREECLTAFRAMATQPFEEGLWVIDAPQESCFYIEDTCPLIRPGKGEMVIGELA